MQPQYFVIVKFKAAKILWHPSVVELYFVVLLHPTYGNWQPFFRVPYFTVKTGVVWSPHA